MNTTILIIMVVAMVLLGVLSVILDVRKRYKQQQQISDYTTQVAKLADKLANKEDITPEANYIIAHSPAISKLFNSCTSPTIILSSRLSQNGLYGIGKYINEIGEDELQTQQRLEDEKYDVLKQLWNPFTLFYRGVGFVLRYVFGYFIELFYKDFDYEGKVWKTITTIFTAAATIFTILTFFGYDWAKIMAMFNK